MITTQFLQNCQAGDEEAIETLVRAHQRSVFQLALSLLDDTPFTGQIAPDVLHDAETVTRETFVAALDRLGRYREDTPFEPWLYAVTIGVTRKHARRRWFRRLIKRTLGGLVDSRRASVYEQQVSQAAPVPEGSSDAHLWDAVRVLPDSLRLAVVLRYYHDLSTADIARVLRLSEGAVHARLDAARERIGRSI